MKYCIKSLRNIIRRKPRVPITILFVIVSIASMVGGKQSESKSRFNFTQDVRLAPGDYIAEILSCKRGARCVESAGVRVRLSL